MEDTNPQFPSQASQISDSAQDTEASQTGQASLESQASSAPQASLPSLAVVFSGKSGEFFKIWIVNMLLSIVTLGIYSAWAKVRTKQYFYGHTSLDGHSFRYLAKPMQILKGRIIAVAVFIAYSVLSAFNPMAAAALAIAFLFVFPWLLMQGLRFNMRMTSFRNVRFGFHAGYGGTFLHFIVLPILGLCSFYLAMPWVMKRIDQFIHQNISYGNKPLHVDTETGTYYFAAIAAVGTLVFMVIAFSLVMVLFGLPGFSEGMLEGGEAGSPEQMASSFGAMAAMLALYWVAFSIIGATYKTIVRNHLLYNLKLEDVAQFRSEMRVMPYAWLTLTNALMVLFTLGLAYPVAAIRKTQYLATVTKVLPKRDAQTVLDDMEQKSSVFGEESSEIFDVDFSIG